MSWFGKKDGQLTPISQRQLMPPAVTKIASVGLQPMPMEGEIVGHHVPQYRMLKSVLPAKTMSWDRREVSKEDAVIRFNGKPRGRTQWDEKQLSWDAELLWSGRRRDGGLTELQCFVSGLASSDDAARAVVRQFFRMAEREGWVTS